MDKLDVSNFDVSNFDVSNFDVNAILRGAQLTLVGGNLCYSSGLCEAMLTVDSQSCSPKPRSLHFGPLSSSCNCRSGWYCHPDHSCHTRTIPFFPRSRAHRTATNKAAQVVGVRVLLWLLSLFVNMDHVTWDESVVDGLHFLEHTVLQVPFFLMTMMRYVTPTLDQM
jgi:hypothetical protein